MALQGPALEARRRAAAEGLPPACRSDFLRLSRSLLHGPRFQWLLVDAPHEGLARQVRDALDGLQRAAGMKVNSLPIGRRVKDIAELEARLQQHARHADVVHVRVPAGWFRRERWEAFNVRRERLAAEAPARWLFWTDAPTLAAIAEAAPDLWAWRAGTYAFHAAPVASPVASTRELAAPSFSALPLDEVAGIEAHRRVEAIRGWLARHPEADASLRTDLLNELGDRLMRLGLWDEAWAHWEQEVLPLHLSHQGGERDVAITRGRMADILQARGQLDEALRIRQHEQLPVYERLGDVRSKAVTQGQIADILQARGQLDEALRIRQHEELPVYERLGDVRSKAATQGQIADTLQARGQLEEALRIREEEQLSVYERLGDVRSKAITQGKIADILQARGQLDEALRIREQDELPAYERLGDVRAKAITQGKIADILQARGQLEEALRIRQHEEMPIYERMGDVRAKAITRGKIADILQARGQLDEALLLQAEQLAAHLAMGDIDGEAAARWSLAKLLMKGAQAKGDDTSAQTHLQRALRLMRQLQRPDGLAAVGWTLATLQAQQGQAAEARATLDEAEAAARRLPLPDWLNDIQALRAQLDQPSAPPA